VIQRLLAACLALLVACAPGGGPSSRPGVSLPEGLVLVIVVDQMRADELDPAFGGGLGWLARKGRVYPDALVDHAHTETCPGHAVLLTGHHPGPAGVLGNVFVLRDSGETSYCVDDPRPEAAAFAGDGGRSPRWLRVTALGDWLQQVDPDALVQVVSGKDRAAIMLGGQHPDAAWWIDQVQGKGFTTSRWYMDSIPRWVEEFNRDEFFSELPAHWTYPVKPESGQRIDDYPAESPRFERTSPHPVRGGDPVADTQGMIWSPWGDEVVLRFALEMVERQKLGRRGHLDVLAVSLSSLDFVGHLYGPESREAQDALRRIDDWLDEFLDEVEDEVDDDRLWIVLSSDHGVTPIPEWLAETGRSECPIPGGRADSRALAIRLNEHLEALFGPSDGDWVQRSGYRFTVSRSNAAERDVKVDDVVKASRRFLSDQRGLRHVWTADEMREGRGPAPFAELYRNSWDEERGGDFEIQPDPGCLFTTYPTGTNHGSPYLPDRAVPLVFQGPGIAPGRVAGRASTVDLAPSLAVHLGIPVPAGLDGQILPLGERVSGR